MIHVAPHLLFAPSFAVSTVVCYEPPSRSAPPGSIILPPPGIVPFDGQSVQSRDLLYPPILFTDRSRPLAPTLNFLRAPCPHETYHMRYKSWNVWFSSSLWLSWERQTVACQPKGPNRNGLSALPLSSCSRSTLIALYTDAMRALGSAFYRSALQP
jgi:hypothetical protein